MQKGLIWLLLGWNFEMILPHLKPTPSNFSNCKIWGKNKCLNFRPQIPDFYILVLEFENTIVNFEVFALGFVFWESVVQKWKILISWTKNAWFENFWAWIWKHFCHIWNLLPRVCLVAKFEAEKEILKFGSTNASFCYFWVRIWKEYCHIWNQHPWICLISKLYKKTKILKFKCKKVLFDYFWAGTLKWYCHIWNQHPRIFLIAKFEGKTNV